MVEDNVVKLTTISINLKRDSKGCYVTFTHNGVPMNEADFVNYHTVAMSTKEKGKGIGFAGVGAKIFMAAWQNAEITTITGKDSDVLVSRMWRERREDGKDEVVWETNIDGAKAEAVIGHAVSDHEYGTTYTVRVPARRPCVAEEKLERQPAVLVQCGTHLEEAFAGHRGHSGIAVEANR